MAWRLRGQSEKPNPKSFVLCRVFIPATGYMILTEQGRLETKKEGEWRLYGELKTRDTMRVDEVEVLLYEVIVLSFMRSSEEIFCSYSS